MRKNEEITKNIKYRVIVLKDNFKNSVKLGILFCKIYENILLYPYFS